MAFVVDDAFPLTKHCIKSHGKKNLSEEERVFDYHCSRLRRVSENVFGILTHRFRFFSTRLSLTPGKTEILVMASLVLHNLCYIEKHKKGTLSW